MNNTVYNHIDAPIRKAVAGMNLLGFNTYMSCCGFSYENEEVKKSHLGKAYMYLDFEQVWKNPRLCDLLTKISLESNWNYDRNRDFIDFYAKTWKKNHPWSDYNSVHHYEVFLLAIKNLNDTIKRFENSFLDSVEIKDGNLYYLEKVSSFWNYKPLPSWTIEKENWENIKS